MKIIARQMTTILLSIWTRICSVFDPLLALHFLGGILVSAKDNARRLRIILMLRIPLTFEM